MPFWRRQFQKYKSIKWQNRNQEYKCSSVGDSLIISEVIFLFIATMAAANCSLSRAPEKPQLTSRLKRYHLLLSRAVLAQETFQGPNDHLDVNMFNILTWTQHWMQNKCKGLQIHSTIYNLHLHFQCWCGYFTTASL